MRAVDPRLWGLFQNRFPGWGFQIVKLPRGGELISFAQKLIMLDEGSSDIKFDMAHATAHLVLHRKELEMRVPVSEEHCQQADDLADCWLSWVLEPANRPEGVGGS